MFERKEVYVRKIGFKYGMYGHSDIVRDKEVNIYTSRIKGALARGHSLLSAPVQGVL